MVSATRNSGDIEKPGNVPTSFGAEEKPVSNWKKPYQFYLASLSLWLAVLIVSLDSTGLAVAIPVMTTQLGGTTLEAFWASISFMLAVTVVQPIYVTTSDVLGRRIPLFVALGFFFVGAIVFAVAENMATVIAGRVLQGFGGGGLDVLSEVIVTDMTTMKERPLWIGLLSFPMAVGSILGPIIGALFSEYATWRWLGWYNLPIIGITAPLAFFFMQLKPLEDSLASKLRRLDWLGMLLFAIGAILFSVPLSWAGAMYPWGSWQTLVPFIIGILFLIGFAIYEKWPTEPVFPHRIFGNITAQTTLVGAFIHGAILYALLLYLPLYFQAVFVETPLQAAVHILPLCVFVVVLSGAAAFAVEASRMYRWEIWVGWILLAVGIGLMSLWDRNTSTAETAGFQVLAGTGLGILFTVPTIAMQASAPTVDDQGLAIGVLVSFRLFGGLVGLAVGATAFTSTFESAIASLGSLPESVAILKESASAVAFIPRLREVTLPQGLMDAIINAYGDSLRNIWYVLAAFAAIAGIASVFLKELSLESEEVGRQNWEVKEETS
ncbi:putative efflux pump antibiotic resistance protein [Mytilinidion resinicola]|uniref:Efflux pump antibiotic resistance protein n=1 Tax=Mytilinidion resinicola TaxID=574789 RepID=A0A6A6YZY8_9PEZI|nr:putative efflux pump antibiotic resistance protein [Mytilinidion resinicola]KAF2814496.1 putative efflux pump antibiotic resistance protein [Mytilinidion resinicola]